MARPKSKGAYAPLAAHYYLDDAILEAGPDAELLWVRILSFLASVPQSNGFITDRQVRTVGINLRGVQNRVRSLQEVGLLTAEPGGFAARSWLKWNRSAEEIGKTLAKDRDRKASKQAEVGQNSVRIPTPFRTDSDPQYRTVQSSTEQNSKDVAEIRPDVSRLCTVLADLIESNGSKRPTVGKGWLDAARLLLDTDHRPMAEALALIQWCQADPFWRGNILSMPKFREKYDTLRLQRQTPSSAATRRPSVTEGNLAVVAEYANRERLEIPK